MELNVDHEFWFALPASLWMAACFSYFSTRNPWVVPVMPHHFWLPFKECRTIWLWFGPTQGSTALYFSNSSFFGVHFCTKSKRVRRIDRFMFNPLPSIQCLLNTWLSCLILTNRYGGSLHHCCQEQISKTTNLLIVIQVQWQTDDHNMWIHGRTHMGQHRAWRIVEHGEGGSKDP